MKAIPPPPPTSSSTTASALSSPRVQLIGEPPLDTARLPVGASLKGHVLSDAPRGLVHIQSDAGMLVGKSTLPLAKGTDVTLLLQARTPRLHFQITATNGQASHAPHVPPASSGRPPPVAAVSVTPRVPDAPAAVPPGTARTLPLIPGATVNATLIKPGAGVSAAPAAGSQVAGLRIAVRVISVQTPPAGGHGATAAPAGSVAGPPALTPGQTLGGHVMTPAAGGTPLLATPIGALGLDGLSVLPRGTAVSLRILTPPSLPSGGTPSVSPAAATPAIAPPSPAGAGWPALDAALETVHGINPAAIRHVMDSVLPGFDAGLTSRTLFFLRALGRGNVRDWLGETATEVLKGANPGLLSQLGEEFRQMARSTAETERDDWRVVHLPLSSGAEIEPVRLLMRRHGRERNASGQDDPDTRFVIDVTLSRLGRIQFDGLVRDDGKRLDLMVRSDPPLPPALHDKIRALFTRSGETAGLRGEVGFQATPPEFVDVVTMPPARSPQRHDCLKSS